MSRKGENIYKRKDGRWEGRYIKSRSPAGKAIYGYVYAKTYREVKDKLHAAHSKTEISALEDRCDNSDFESIALEWLQNKKLHVKESTSNKYYNLLYSYVLPSFGKKQISSITCDFIESQCDELSMSGGKLGTGLSKKTIADILSVIRNIMRFAVRKGKTVSCDPFSIQIKHPIQEMRVLSRSEQDTLYKYLCEDIEPCNIGILLSLFTGMRVGEICALRWEDISFLEQTIFVHQTMQRIQDRNNSERKTKIVVTTPKSACSIRTIPIPEDLLPILKSYKVVSTGYFLTNSDQSYIEPRTMQNRFKRALKNCSIENANYHSLRHTFATRCIELGFDIKSLSEILGHASVNITLNRYVHPSLELKRANMQRLSVLFTVK